MQRTPVILVHGMWLHMSSWEAWAARFADHGYSVSVPGWPGEAATVAEARRDPGRLRGLGLDALTAHYERIVRSSPVPPVLIGHSVGGLIVQHLLGANLGRAAVAIAPLPAVARPRLWPLLAADGNGSVPLPPAQFRHTVANTVGEQEAAALFDRYVVLAPRRLLTDLGLDGTDRAQNVEKIEDAENAENAENTAKAENAADPEGAAAIRGSLAIDTANTTRGPLLLISGQEDRMVADAVTRSVYKLYGDSPAVSDLKQFADRGHSLVVDSGWRAVADYVLAWLADNGVTATAPDF